LSATRESEESPTGSDRWLLLREVDRCGGAGEVSGMAGMHGVGQRRLLLEVWVPKVGSVGVETGAGGGAGEGGSAVAVVEGRERTLAARRTGEWKGGGGSGEEGTIDS
jgi:hypothetical protein